MKRIFFLIPALAITACANTHPIQTVGPDTYTVTHKMAATAPAAGVRNALETMGREQCAKQDNAPFHKLDEKIETSGKYQTITLTFTCKPVLKSTAYTVSAADTFSTPGISYTAPLQPSQELIDFMNKQKQ